MVQVIDRTAVSVPDTPQLAGRYHRLAQRGIWPLQGLLGFSARGFNALGFNALGQRTRMSS